MKLPHFFIQFGTDFLNICWLVSEFSKFSWSNISKQVCGWLQHGKMQIPEMFLYSYSVNIVKTANIPFFSVIKVIFLNFLNSPGATFSNKLVDDLTTTWQDTDSRNFSSTFYSANIVKTANILFLTNVINISIFIQVFQSLIIGFVNLKNLYIISM